MTGIPKEYACHFIWHDCDIYIRSIVCAVLSRLLYDTGFYCVTKASLEPSLLNAVHRTLHLDLLFTF